MTILSDQDIKKELGINIYIYPYKTQNLKGASYNLTASKLAWDLNTKKSIYHSDEEKIIIEGNTSALIETNETIWVSEKIAGTYYSRVRKVSEGTGHISTTLDPNYLGCSLIALHNHSKEPIEIEPETDPFVTIIFQYLHTPSTTEHRGNTSGRRELLSTLGITLSKKETKFLDQDFMNDKDALLNKLRNSNDYQEIDKKRKEEANQRLQQISNQKKNIFFKKQYIILSSCLIVLIMSAALLDNKQNKLASDPSDTWYNTANKVIEWVIPTITVILVNLWFNDIDRKSNK